MSFPRYKRYKDSGVDWLSEVPEHWAICRSRRLFAQRKERIRDSDEQLTASQKHGILTQDAFMKSEGRAVVRVVHGAEILKHVEPDDFVISMRSFQGGLEWSGIRGCISSAYVMLAPSASVHSGFFRHLFKSDVYIQALQTTSNLVRDGQAMRYENFTLIDLPVPSKEEQRSIARFLDSEVEKIEGLVEEQRRLIELLKEKRQAVISHAVTSCVDSGLGMTEAARTCEGGVPVGSCPAIPLKRLCLLLKDGTHLPPDRVDAGVPLLSVRNLVDGRFILLDDDSMISEESYTELSRSYVPEPGDVLLAIVGATLGKTAIVPQQIGRFHIQRSVAIFRPRPSLLMSEFLYYCFQSTSFQSLLWEYAGFSAQPGIYLGALQNFRIAVPPIARQLAVVEYLRARTHSFDTLVRSGESAISLLQERRAALISAAVTGKIDVRGYSSKETA